MVTFSEKNKTKNSKMTLRKNTYVFFLVANFQIFFDRYFSKFFWTLFLKIFLTSIFRSRFICEDTIEEKILKIQIEKMSLAESALTGAKRNASKLTIEDLKDLFGMK